MKLISIVTPCFNEVENVQALHSEIVRIMSDLPTFSFEHIYIDNASTDGTVTTLRRMAAEDRRVKVILNTRNFGHIRSPYHGILQAHGDAVISIAADLQEPPRLIKEFIREWERGCNVIMGVKARSEEPWFLFTIRKLYYRMLGKMSDIHLVANFTGFGLYDRKVVEVLRTIDDPYPYFRGMIADLGFDYKRIEFTQPLRKHGISKNNFYKLLDMAMLGFTSNTKVPLRITMILGLLTSAISFLVGLGYFILKLIHWEEFALGLAPLLIGISFLGGIQILLLGIVGEYVGAIYTQVLHRPHVIEKERINFDKSNR